MSPGWRMKILLDEHLSSRIAEALRAKGRDVITVSEIGLGEEQDRAVWERAIAENRVLVTYDTSDFPTLFTLLFHEGVHHPGLVVISSRTIAQHDIGGLQRALEELIEGGEDLSNQTI